MPPEQENRPLTWPYWPYKLRTSSSHEEGCEREFAIATKEFVGSKGKVTGLKTVRVEWKDGKMVEVPGSEQDLQGRPGAAGHGLRQPGGHVLEAFGIDKDARGNAKAHDRFDRRLPDQRGQGVRGRRHAPRPVAWSSGPSAKAARPRARSTSS